MRKQALVGIGAATAAALAVGYPVLWRPRCLTWGASVLEVCREMPGDALLPTAPLVTTRAVTVDAPPSAIWPWLLQMGPGRGGAYTYDWIENLMGLDMHSADRIIPEFQELKPGDTMPLGANGPVMEVAELDPEKALVFFSQDGAWVWSFGLHPQGDATRLISRNRIQPPDPSPLYRLFSLYVMEPGSLVMERRMLLGVKSRAESLQRSQARADGD
ncbi:hypothetical protein [Streptacidiphilus rugosus]|uniref:hypothetical protein n=1 Tax=Streptacidiphilus rugosus TaxID=405783 RepID=UPI00055F622E|nr:hypothetical protein [Streptacidiphilus rugosus]